MSFFQVLAGTRARAAVSSAVGGLGIGSLFGDNDSIPIVGDMQNMTMVVMALGVVVALGQLFDVQLGG